MQISNGNIIHYAENTTLLINMINNKLLRFTKGSRDLCIRLYMRRFFSSLGARLLIGLCVDCMMVPRLSQKWGNSSHIRSYK